MLSRVAENLYWASRYLERAGHTARVIDVHLHREQEQPRQPTEAHWQRVCDGLRVAMPVEAPALPEQIARVLTFDLTNPASVLACISFARENTRQARQEISSEMWEQVNRLYLSFQDPGMAEKWLVEPHGCYVTVKSGVYLFQGVTDDTMTHGEGWHFIQLGRFLERAESMTVLLDSHLGSSVRAGHSPDASTYLEMAGLLECCVAVEAFCKVHSAALEPTRVLQFLLFDPAFPHSLRCCAGMMQTSLQAIGRGTGRTGGRTDRLAGRLRAMLDYAQIEDLPGGDAHAFLREVQHLCAEIHTAAGHTYIAPRRIPDGRAQVYPAAVAAAATIDQ